MACAVVRGLNIFLYFCSIRAIYPFARVYRFIKEGYCSIKQIPALASIIILALHYWFLAVHLFISFLGTKYYRMDPFFTKIYFGNLLYDWLISLGTFALGFVVILIFKRIVLNRVKRWSLRSKTNIDDVVILIIERSVVPLLYLGVFHLALNVLQVDAEIAAVIRIATLIFITFFVLRIITGLIKEFLFSFIGRRNESETKEKQAQGLLLIINIVVWILGIVFIIDNLGYNVTTIVTGLGIGGIAIALAAQTILGDLFSYFVIFFDRPFEIGDFIIVEDKMGTIEYIGIKTTRVRTLNGEQLICSNTYLTNARVHNYKRMDQRRIVFKLGVSYQTGSDMLNEIP